MFHARTTPELLNPFALPHGVIVTFVVFGVLDENEVDVFFSVQCCALPQVLPLRVSIAAAASIAAQVPQRRLRRGGGGEVDHAL